MIAKPEATDDTSRSKEPSNLSNNRIKKVIDESRFPVCQNVLSNVLRKKAGVQIENYGEPKPKRDRPPKSERILKRALPQLRSQIVASLKFDSIELPWAEEDQLKYLATCCQQMEEQLKGIFDCLMSFIVGTQLAGIYISSKAEFKDVSPRSVRKDLTQQAEKFFLNRLKSEQRCATDHARQLGHDLVANHLEMTKSYEDLGEPVLDGKSINENDIEQLVHLVKQRMCKKADRVAQVFLDVIRHGLHAGLFSEVEGLGATAQTFRYRHHHIGVHGNATVAQPTKGFKSEWMRRVKSVVTTQTLIEGKLYAYTAMLSNRSLDIPYQYRLLLENAPLQLRESLSGLFGTQTLEEHEVTEEITTRRTFEHRVIHMDPCVMLFGSICLFGWGSAVMATFSEHQKIVNKQRKYLNAEARLRGMAGAYLLSAVVLGGMMALFSFSIGLLGILPGAFCALWCVGMCVFALLRARLKRQAEARWTTAALERMEAQYPGFDASSPRLVDEEGKSQ